MDTLRAMKMFVRLTELGSFTQLAEQTGNSKSMVSKELTKLETELGSRLLHRTTRNLKLTHAGEGYLQRCKTILDQIDEAEGFVQDLQNKPKGKLKINAPMALGLTDLDVLFADFMQMYPDILLDIHLGDEDIDLVEHGFDLGLRASSTMIDSTYVGKPVAKFDYKICVSPNYFEHHPTITNATDLTTHNCFVYNYFKGKNTWPLDGGVSITGSLKVNSTFFMLEPIKRGLGIGFLPEFIYQQHISEGSLIEILPDIERPCLTLYALYPVRKFIPSRLVQCIDFIETWFKTKYG